MSSKANNSKESEAGKRIRGTKRGAAQLAGELIRARILTGQLVAGQTLPGERELSEELGISRITLRSALAHLEAEGLVQTMHGSGTRVLDYRESAGVDVLGHLATLALSGAKVNGGLDMLASLLELRRAVGADAIALATERATVEELRAMRDHVVMLGKLVGEPHAFMVADLAFARMIIRATRNLAYELLFNTVVRTVEGNPGLELAFYANAPATIAVYRRLLERMKSRDAERARATAARLLYRLDRTTVDALRALMPAQVSTRSPSSFDVAVDADEEKGGSR